MRPTEAVLFDVDGVLIDSLDAHLRFCRDQSERSGLGLNIPAAAEFKRLLRAGNSASPMIEFFRMLGFPDEAAAVADEAYTASFRTQYETPVYPGTFPTLMALSLAGFPLGLVTANTRANVEAALGSLFDLFDPALVFARDHELYKSKTTALAATAVYLHVRPQQLLFVGDMPSDRKAAGEAGTQFLATNYGWGFEPGDVTPEVARISGVGRYVLG